MKLVPSGHESGLGARVEGLDLARPLADREVAAIRTALGRHGVLCFPWQSLEPAALAAFGARFGELEVHVVSKAYQAPDLPQVMVLSNMTEDGKPIGLADAGQGWHTDMSYNRIIALANILHAKRVPRRDGRALGDTEFLNMHRAYDELPAEVKTWLEGRLARHDFNKFWDMMCKRPGSLRQPLTPEQRRNRPPVTQPIVRTHPVTGRKVLYCNPGYAIAIEGMEPAESDALLDFLFRHQSQDQYRYAHRWSEGDVVMWDDIGTTHQAVADYGSDEPRFMYRVQVMASAEYCGLRDAGLA